jgi:3-hydroxyisobutyrate dehydrogenase
MPVGFIGVGNIGSPMAHQILRAGFSLVVHDVRKEAADSLLEAGAVWANSPPDLAQQCEVVITCLPGPPEMEEVMLGGGGVVDAIQPGSLCIDHSTNAPTLVQKVHEACSSKGVGMVDAPVSGGLELAQTRDLLVMVGGDANAVERATPYLDAIAKRVMHTGPIGSGCICKILHNSASFTLDVVMAECWTTGVRAGVDPNVLVKVFNEGALGHMISLKVRLRDTYLKGDFDPRFALKLARKDLGLATDLAREYGVPVRLVELCEQEMVAAMERGWAERDTSIMLTLQEERAGAQVRTTGAKT